MLDCLFGNECGMTPIAYQDDCFLNINMLYPGNAWKHKPACQFIGYGHYFFCQIRWINSMNYLRSNHTNKRHPVACFYKKKCFEIILQNNSHIVESQLLGKYALIYKYRKCWNRYLLASNQASFSLLYYLNVFKHGIYSWRHNEWKRIIWLDSITHAVYSIVSRIGWKQIK